MNNIENVIIEKFLDEKIPLDKAVELLEAAEKKHEGPIKQTKNRINQFKKEWEDTDKQIEEAEKRIKEGQEKFEKMNEEFEKRKKQVKLIAKAAIAAAAVGIGVSTAVMIHNGKTAEKEMSRMNNVDMKLKKFNDEVDQLMNNVDLKDDGSVEQFKKDIDSLRKKYNLK